MKKIHLLSKNSVITLLIVIIGFETLILMHYKTFQGTSPVTLYNTNKTFGWTQSAFGDVRRTTRGSDKSSQHTNEYSEVLQDLLKTYHHKEPNILYSNTTTLMLHPKPDYLPGFKNPCFLVSQRADGRYFLLTSNQNSNNAAFTFTACLPSFFLAGVRKCGTTDFSMLLQSHPGIHRSTKELQFLNAPPPRSGGKSYTFLYYLVTLKAGVVHSPLGEDKRFNNSMLSDGLEPDYGRYKLLGDYTPGSTIMTTWQNDLINKGLEWPKVLLPHKIRYLMPDAKVIFILRDPTARTSSDYRFTIESHHACSKFHCENATKMATIFHQGMRRAIQQWKLCVKFYKNDDKQCMYQSYTRKFLENEPKYLQFSGRDALFWSFLVTSLYHVPLSEYYNIIPKENILVIHNEKYSENRVQVMNEQVFPFLGLSPLNKKMSESLSYRKDHKMETNIKFRMMPKTEVMLHEFYAPYQRKVANLIAMYS